MHSAAIALSTRAANRRHARFQHDGLAVASIQQRVLRIRLFRAQASD
ncbi:hypothetical protein [Xanthomonas fragariae]|nr:hypothetical protein [Xanthomonas fragariae]